MWMYQGKPFEGAEGYAGFTYEIRNLVDGRCYIGKKLLTKAKTQAPLKGKKRKRRSRVESDWRDYWGSSEELKADVEKLGEDKFEREVIRLCKTKGGLSYYELKAQVDHDVLFHPDKYYNAYVGARIHRKHLSRET